MMAGLGIDFNPPPSPPPVNTAVVKLRSFQSLGKSLPTERDARLALNNREANVGRRVRIVSAANVYHEQEDEEEYAGSDDNAVQDAMDYGEDYDDEDILDDYAGPSPNLQDTDAGSSPGSMISPAPTSYTMQTMQSLGAVSSGSSTRDHDAETMQQMMPALVNKAEDFEARLRSIKIEAYQPDPSLYAIQTRSFSIGIAPAAPSGPATARGNLPPAADERTGLRRAPAMSRPRSMMELGQLAAHQSIHGASAPETAKLQLSSIATSPSVASAVPTFLPSGTSDALQNCAAVVTVRQKSQPINTHTAPLQAACRQEIESSSQELRKARCAISMRSQASMRGLELAEIGGGAVVTDSNTGGFLAGIPYVPQNARDLKSPPVVGEDAVTRDLARQLRSRAMSVATSRLSHAVSLPVLNTVAAQQTLQRQSTLLSAGANPMKRAKELDRLLAPKPMNAKSQYTAPTQSYNTMQISSQPVHSPGGTTFQSVDATGYQPGKQQTSLKRKASTVVLEQGVKGKARVAIDLVLASELVVEGGPLRGRMEVRVRKDKDGEGVVWLGAVKARIVGFEGAYMALHAERI